MRKKFNRLAWRLLIIILIWTATLILSSCTCGDEGTDGEDDDTNDDTDNDDSDDTDDDDDAEGWHVYTIIPNLVAYSSIALDSNDKVHIGYGFSKLRYVTNETGSWQIFIIDSSDNYVGQYPSISLDSSNKIHISYYDPYSYIKYATNKTGSWQTYAIADIGSDLGNNNDIVLDSNDKVHIAYFHCDYDEDDGDCDVEDLKYATNKSGAWQIYVVDAGRAGWHPSIAKDIGDKIHISYGKSGVGDTELWYATNATGSWQEFKIGELFSGMEGYNSIALDSNGKVHISYYDGGRNLSYATNVSGTWESFKIDSNKKTGVDNSISIDSSDKVHISYADAINDDLKYATNKSGTWEIITIDSGGGSSTSIAIDSNDYVHISYSGDGSLKYATNRPPE